MGGVIGVADLAQRSGVQFGTSGVRGLVEAMNNDVCYAYTAAFLQVLRQQGHPATRVVLGHDLRPSSPRIAQACAAAIASTGAEVVYAGAQATPALAYFAQQLGVVAVVVTGSHIPFDRNGIKFYRKEGEISKADEVAIGRAAVNVPQPVTLAALPAAGARAEALYVQRYVDFFGSSALSGKRVAVYQHSSVARDVVVRILRSLGAETIALGRSEGFVPIDTEAVRREDVAQAHLWATEHVFDAIVSTDGDADRPLIGDEQGNWLRGDVVGILCARQLGMETVVTPVSSNTALEQSGWFGSVLRTRIGSPFVIAGMEKALAQGNGAVAGYEANGGFLLGSDLQQQGKNLHALPTRDAVLPMVALLVRSAQRKVPMSALSGELPQRFTFSERIQGMPTAASRELLSRLTNNLPEAATLMAPGSGGVMDCNTVDGLRLTFADGCIVHLRPSGNAPELRCYAEASTEAFAKALCLECLQRLA